MSEIEYDYSEPWQMFAGEEKPWTDLERVLRLDDKMDTQKEMGDALGCHPSTVSTWLQKAKKSRDVSLDSEEQDCMNWEVCGNQAPTGRMVICDSCLDLVRTADRERGPNFSDYDEREEFMEEAYEHYDVER